MKKFIIKEDGEINFDGDIIGIEKIDSEFLNSLFELAIMNEVEFDIDDKPIISELFKNIKEVCGDMNSDINKLRNENLNEFNQVKNDVKSVEEMTDFDELDEFINNIQ